MAYVNFGRKNTRIEALTSENRDKIFFPTDSNSIILGGREFGTATEYLTQDQYDELVRTGMVDPTIEYNIQEDDN